MVGTDEGGCWGTVEVVVLVFASLLGPTRNATAYLRAVQLEGRPTSPAHGRSTSGGTSAHA
ncbi:hypothetical protein L226DRAFT_531394 [Lentinus tigrinus ALCF2SS1-7]|uniref:uncharacterized protein n=1 Tax=Lentinus tigrinus ALCF2SS1-7 TaxID=1328758 RepID=UPI001165E4A9|nr:hypothetical protein L226DRAFT_531394 [Lentinus tigrinus ALCF2SS1-7]